MYFIFTIYLGAIFGSFINLVQHRKLRGESIIYPRSHCEACGKNLSFYELFPIFSYILLKGRCKNCGEKIGNESLIIEMACGVLSLLAFRYSFTFQSILIFASLIIGLLISIIDLKTMEIYQNHLLIMSGLGIIYRLIYIGFSWDYILEVIVFSVIYWLIFKISKENIGDGDYYFYVGLSLFLKDRVFVPYIFLSIWLGALVGIIILIKDKSFGRHMPFAIFIFISYVSMLSLDGRFFLWILKSEDSLWLNYL